MEQNEIRRRPRTRSPIQQNRQLQGWLLSLLLVGVVILFVVLGLLIKDREFSESENRNLAQPPALTWSSLTDGSFFSGLDSYTADQFPGRDMWMGLNLWLNKTLGQKESGGVYLCEDDYLMQIPEAPNAEQLERNLTAIDAFCDANPELNAVMTVVPNAVTVLADKLPENAPVRDQRADLSGIADSLEKITFLDVTDVLTEHSDEALFYRTDHHWTSLGAYYTFCAVSEALGVPAPELSSYTRYLVSDTFEGTLSSKSGSHKVTDEVEVFVPDTEIDYYVTYEGNQQGICSMYDRTALEGKDHYTVFFGGNYSRVDITTTADTHRVLLLFKDSYANCFVQFLYPYFDHITIIDPRYYYDSVENVIRSEGVTDVLFLYNLDTFLSDSSLADVLGS